MLTFLMNNRSVLQLPTFGAHIYILLLITSKDLYRKKALEIQNQKKKID